MLFHYLPGLTTLRDVAIGVFPGFFFYFHFYIRTKYLSYTFVFHFQYSKTIFHQFSGYSPQRALQELALFSN